MMSMPEDQPTPMITHSGSCHCKTVCFKFDGPKDLVAWDCDCSICAMKRNVHVIVPEGRFTITQGEDNLSIYQFNTGMGKHLFCKTCGICPFYRPRSNPDGYAVTVYCITSPTVRTLTIKKFHGQQWEEELGRSGIQGLSKAS